MNPLEEFIREITQELDIPLRPWCPGSSSLSSQQQGECDHRHEDVAGLATLKKGSNAREQFAALALLSHPRCGSVANQRKMVPTVVTSTGEKRSSKKNKGGKKSKHTRTEQIRATEEHGDSVAQVGDGEGGMMSVDWPVLLRTLWEWCVDRHTRAFYWVVAADDGNVLTTFSVCTATMGVVREAEGWWCGSGATHCLISGNRDVRVRTATWGNMKMCHYFSMTSAPQYSRCIVRDHSRIRSGMSSNEANHKWWVNYDGAASVSVASLATFNQPEIRLLPVYQGRPMAQMNLMFFNKLDPDELCMIWCNFDDSPSKTLMVASLANTSATGACQVLSPSTSYSFSELHNYHETGLVFTKKGGKRSFIILTWPLQPLQHIRETSVVWRIQEHSGAISKLCEDPGTDSISLSQLSASLFCISRPHKFEIWDIGNTSKALRVISLMPNCTQVVAEVGGFLSYVFPSTGKIKVTEACLESGAGRLLTTVQFPPSTTNSTTKTTKNKGNKQRNANTRAHDMEREPRLRIHNPVSAFL